MGAFAFQRKPSSITIKMQEVLNKDLVKIKFSNNLPLFQLKSGR